MEEKSKILIIGVTGNLGYQIARASIKASHPTFALVRDSAFSDPLKSQKLCSLSDSGATLLKVIISFSSKGQMEMALGCLEDEKSLVEALNQVDVVISAIPPREVLAQQNLIRAIKLVGSIKRFFPAEFGQDPDKVQIYGMDYYFLRKADIRRLIELEGIPYTCICCNFFMSVLLPSLVQPGLKAPPRDEVTVFGDGNAKGVFVKEDDVATFTISAVDDPRTLNKVMHLRPPGNVYSMNELIEIWESKIGKKLNKLYVSEEELLTRIKETPYPLNMQLIFIYSAFVKGDQTYFDIDSSGGVEGTQLYPHVQYTTISQYLDTLL